MNITFWGVRGSVPTPHPRTFKYGGNTPCVEIRTPAGHTIILDCGTGVMHLGDLLTARTPADGYNLMIFLSHFHWDHIQGLPFFAPLYDARNQLFFHCFEAQGMTARGALGGLMLTPFFPVDMSVMKANKNFYTIGEERLKVFDVDITTCHLNHPQGCLAFRIESEDGVFVYASDHERGNSKYDEALAKLSHGADLLLADSQYTPEEYPSHKGWGHSTWMGAIEGAREAEAKELVLFHHDPNHSDLFLDKMVMDARAVFPAVHCASEGATATLQHKQGATFQSALEQRQCQRIPVTSGGGVCVRLQRVGMDEVEYATVGDVSLDGSYFLVQHDWDIGTELDVEVTSANAENGSEGVIRMRGVVARSEKTRDRTGIGVTYRARRNS